MPSYLRENCQIQLLSYLNTKLLYKRSINIAKREKLAIYGGSRAVTIDSSEQWKRPIEKEKKLISKLLEEGFLSGEGRNISKEFEEKFRKFIGAKYCLLVDHGGNALTSAYYAVGVGPGDEVITPTIGYIQSYAGALHMGARPVFCDIEPETFLMDPVEVEKKITKRTRAINVIHLKGNICNMDALRNISKRYGIAIVEDAAHAHGAEWNGKKIGNLGDITCFSLQGADPEGKPVAAGEGGLVTTNDRELYERQLIYCHLHRVHIKENLTNSKYRDFDSEVLGLKWRAHPLALAIAMVSLESVEYRNQKKFENRKTIFDALEKLLGLEPVRTYEKSKPGGFFGGLDIKYHPEELGGLSAQKFVEAVTAEGAPISGPGFLYMEHLRRIFTHGFDLWGRNRGPLGGEFLGLPPFKTYNKGDFPVAEFWADKVLTLPTYIEPKEGFLCQFIQAFEKVISNYESLL